jgi:hypothetical protein
MGNKRITEIAGIKSNNKKLEKKNTEQTIENE